MTLGPHEVFELQRRTVVDYDMAGQADLFAEDGVMEFPFAPPGFPRRLAGREQIASVLAAAVEPVRASGRRLTGYHSLVVHDTADPEVLIAEFEVHGRTADGDTYELPYVQVFRIRDGRIVSLRDYWSGATAQAALGETAGQAGQAANKELVRRYMQMWNTADPTGIEDLLAPDWVDHAHPEVTSVQAVADLVAKTSGLQITLDDMVAEGDTVAFRRTVNLNGEVSQGMGFIRIAGGRLAEQWSIP